MSKLVLRLKPLPVVLPKAAKYIIIRHCFKLKTSDEHWNKLNEYKHFKPHDTPLSKTGKEQAEILCKLMKYQNINRIISSPYRRCVETVLPMARQFQKKICIEPGLSETAKSQEHINGFETNDVLKLDYGSSFFEDSYDSFVKPLELRTVEDKTHSIERATKTIIKISDKFKTDNQHALVICTHSTPCGAIMKELLGETVYFRFGSVSFVYDTRPGKISYSLLNTLED